MVPILLTALTVLMTITAVEGNGMVPFRLKADVVDTYLADVLTLQSASLTKLTTRLETMYADCERKVNKSLDGCNACTATQCRASPPKPNVGTMILGGLHVATGVLKKPFEALAKNAGRLTVTAAGKLRDGLGTAVSFISQDAKKALEGVINKIGDAFETAAKGFGGEFLNIAHKTGQGFATIGKTIATGAKKAVDAIGNFFEGVGGFFGDLFGRRRRRRSINPNLDANTLDCYRKCSDCTFLTLEGEEAQVEHVCGSEIRKSNASSFALSQSIITLSDDVGNGDIVEVKYDLRSVDFATGVAKVTEVHGKMDGKPFHYLSTVPLKLFGMSPEEETKYTTDILDMFMPKWVEEFNKQFKF